MQVEEIAAFTHFPWREVSGISHEKHITNSFDEFYRGENKQPFNCTLYSNDGYKLEIHKVSYKETYRTITN